MGVRTVPLGTQGLQTSEMGLGALRKPCLQDSGRLTSSQLDLAAPGHSTAGGATTEAAACFEASGPRVHGPECAVGTPTSDCRNRHLVNGAQWSSTGAFLPSSQPSELPSEQAQRAGCMGMSTAYKKQGETIKDEDVAEVFKRASELGVRMLSTCEFYGAERHNEKLIARCSADLPKDSFDVALKVGGVGDISGLKLDCTPSRLKETVDESLKILGKERIELLVQARQAPGTPLEEVVQCFKELVNDGKAVYIGLSEVNSDILRKAHAIHPITCVEQEWSLWSRDIEEDIIPTCKELGIGVLAYSPLGRGFLTGALTKESLKELDSTDFRVAGQPRLQGENLDKNLALVEMVKKMAQSKGCTTGQIALAWVYKQAQTLGVTMVAIPGTKRVKYLEQNVAALDVQLSGEEHQQLCDAFAPDAVAGDRYAQKYLMYSKE